MMNYFDLMIPDFSQILDFYKSKLTDVVNTEQLSPLLDLYGYHQSLILLEDYQPIVSYQSKNIEKLNKIADKEMKNIKKKFKNEKIKK